MFDITVKNLFGNGKKIVISEPEQPWIPDEYVYNSKGKLVQTRTITCTRILTGINGFGKTTIFNIITDVFGDTTSFNDEYYKSIHFDEFKICTSNSYIVIKHPGADTEFTIRSFERGNPIVERLYVKYDPNDRSDIDMRVSLMKKRHILFDFNVRSVTHIRDDRFAYIYESTKCILHRINKSEYKHEIYERLKKILDKRAAFTPVTLIEDNKIHFLEPIEFIPKAILDEFNIFAEVIMSSSTACNTVLIDMPETNKHISIQEMFMSDITNHDTYLQYSPSIIITTHSPYIVHEYCNLIMNKEVSDIAKTK